MLLNRTRSYDSYEPVTRKFEVGEYYNRTQIGTNNCAGGELHTQSQGLFEREIPVRFGAGSITDYKSPIKLKQFSKGVRKRLRVPFLVKDVVHTKVSLSSFKDEGGKVIPNQGNMTFELSTDASTQNCNIEFGRVLNCSPLGFMAYVWGSDYLRDEIFAELPRTHDAGTVFPTVDWADLADAFDEKTKSLIPSSFFLGETMYESSIFKTALSFVVSPSRAVGRLIKDVQMRGLHRLNLGKIAHYYRQRDRRVSHLRSYESVVSASNRSIKLLADRDVGTNLFGNQLQALTRFTLKELVDLHLSYKFGVVPAIHDVTSMFAAHSEVEKRLKYLNDHRGSYVPIRASKKLPASYTPGDLPSTGSLAHGPVLQDAYTKAVIFGMGKIRDDINEASRWRAYSEYFGLNKIIGLGWELVPFSFVVDWFTNAQEVVNKLTRVPLGESPYMNLACIGHSQKNVSQYDYICNPGYNAGVGTLVQPNSPFSVFEFAISSYTRQSGFPNTSLFDSMSNFGLFRAFTGAELLLQKIL